VRAKSATSPDPHHRNSIRTKSAGKLR